MEAERELDTTHASAASGGPPRGTPISTTNDQTDNPAAPLHTRTPTPTTLVAGVKQPPPPPPPKKQRGGPFASLLLCCRRWGLTPGAKYEELPPKLRNRWRR